MTDIQNSIEFAAIRHRMNEKYSRNGDLDFRQIAYEKLRGYEFPGGSRVIIVSPVAIAHCSPERVGGGSCRIIDIDGVGHYIPAGWIHLWIEPKPEEIAF